MSTASFAAALLMGIAGSLHCAGMCGPIMLVMPFQLHSGFQRYFGILLYHFGRIVTYAFLGALLFSFRGIIHPAWQQYFSVIAGVVLLSAGVFSFLPNTSVQIKLPWTGFVKGGLEAIMWRKNPGWLFVAGSLNGLLPCGMAYMALAAALAMPDAFSAAGIMVAFGFGTMPMMFGISLLKSQLRLHMAALRKWTPMILFLFGSLFVLRGANLGIPVLSPKVVSTTTHEVKIQCCSRPAENP